MNFLLPLLRHALQQVKNKIPASIKYEATEALLAACRVGDARNRQRVLTIGTTIMGDTAPEYLLAEAAYQQSVISRLLADFDGSELSIQSFCRRRITTPSDFDIRQFYQDLRLDNTQKRLYAVFSRLHTSHLENLVQREEYDKAIYEINDWKNSENPSTMEQHVLPKRFVVVAKMF